MGSERGKIVVYEPLTQDFARRPRRQLVPVRPTFFLIYQFNFRPLGIIFWGLGITPFRLAWNVRALTRCRPGEGCAHAGSSGTSPPRVIGRGEFRLAGQLVTVVRHPRAVVASRLTPMRLPPWRPALGPTLRRPTIVLKLRRPIIARVLRRSAIVLGAILSHAMFGLKIAAGVLAVAMVALTIMNYRDAEPAATGVEPTSNQTVVYRRSAPSQPRSEGADAA